MASSPSNTNAFYL